MKNPGIYSTGLAVAWGWATRFWGGWQGYSADGTAFTVRDTLLWGHSGSKESKDTGTSAGLWRPGRTPGEETRSMLDEKPMGSN